MRLATMSMMVSFFLAAMDLKGLAQGGAMAVILVPSFSALRRVEDADGDVLLHGGKDGRGVQDFGAEVGELGGFFEADGLHAQGFGARCAGRWS